MTDEWRDWVPALLDTHDQKASAYEDRPLGEAHRRVAAAIRSLMERPSEASGNPDELPLVSFPRAGEIRRQLGIYSGAPTPGKTADPYERADSEAYLEHPRPPQYALGVIPSEPHELRKIVGTAKTEPAGEADDGHRHRDLSAGGAVVHCLSCEEEWDFEAVLAERDRLRAELAEARKERDKARLNVNNLCDANADLHVQIAAATARAEKAEAAVLRKLEHLAAALSRADAADARAVAAEAALAASVRREDVAKALEAKAADWFQRGRRAGFPRSFIDDAIGSELGMLAVYLRNGEWPDLTMDAGTGETAAKGGE